MTIFYLRYRGFNYFKKNIKFIFMYIIHINFYAFVTLTVLCGISHLEYYFSFINHIHQVKYVLEKAVDLF